METLKIKIIEQVKINESIGMNIYIPIEFKSGQDSFSAVQLFEYKLIILDRVYCGLGSFSNAPNEFLHTSTVNSRDA
ncbi:hypothetical protein AKJ56_00950 [candidate division MSBL1 archaeon SCGC-AAA382N08]|uniref:Uncharacterized protein n=1 Tax=candidate division MSBL1 archaeon SCGC-AAA382N08 TaxID=1698285 RepID=A0A133VQ53_9EURY|nr:hypothetical protein AKJ56_00950 [candidate division MSBL1 archaeon SCGC-AAA382N08]